MADFYNLTVGVDATGAVSSFQVAGAAAERFSVTAKKGVKDVDDSAAGLEQTIKKLAAAWAGLKIVEFTKETVDLAARYETLGVAMVQVAKQAGDGSAQVQLLQQSLMKTGISALESRESLTKLYQAQLDMSKASDLARVAQDAAVIGGINSSEAFGRMVNGIKTAQTETLRTIGINVQFEKGYQTLALQLGKSVDGLSEHEKAQARMNQVMEEGKKIAGTYEAAMETAGKQIQSTKRYLEDMKVKVGEAFLPTYTTLVFDYAKALKFLGENADAVSSAIKALTVAFGTLYVMFKVAALLEFAASVGSIVTALGILGGVAAAVALPIAAIVTAIVAVTSMVYDHSQSVAAARKEHDAWAKTMDALPAAALRRNIALVQVEMKALNDEAKKNGDLSAEQAKVWEEDTKKLTIYNHALRGAVELERARDIKKNAPPEVPVDILKKIQDTQREIANLGKVAGDYNAMQEAGWLNEAKGNEKLIGLLREKAALEQSIKANIDTRKTNDGYDDKVASMRAYATAGLVAGEMEEKHIANQRKAFEATRMLGGARSEEYQKYLASLDKLDAAERAIANEKVLLKYTRDMTDQFRLLALARDTYSGTVSDRNIAKYAEALERESQALRDKFPLWSAEKVAREATANTNEKAYDQSAKAVGAAKDEIKTLTDSIEMLRANRESRRALNIELERDTIMRSAGNKLSEAEATFLAQRIVGYKEYRDSLTETIRIETERRQKMLQPFDSAIGGMQSSFKSALDSILSGGTDVFQRLGDALRNAIVGAITSALIAKAMDDLYDKLKQVSTAKDAKPGQMENPGEVLQRLLGTTGGKVAGGAAAGAAVGYGVGTSIGASGGSATEALLGGAASGAATGAMVGGPIGALVGGVVGAATSLIGFQRAAEEAAKAMEKMQKAVLLSLDAAEASTRGDKLGEGTAKIKSEIAALRKAIEDAWSGGGAQSAQVAARNVELERANALERTRLDLLRAEIAEIDRRSISDSMARNLAATGNIRLAESLVFAEKQSREYAEAVKSGISPLALATLQLAQQTEAAKRLADILKADTNAMEDLTVRTLRATMHGEEADAMARDLAQKREYNSAAERGMSVAYLAALKFAQAAETAQAMADKLLASQRAAQDLETRKARATPGLLGSADDRAFTNGQTRELQDAERNGRDPNYLLLLGATLRQEAMFRELQKTVAADVATLQQNGQADSTAFDRQIQVANDALNLQRQNLQLNQQQLAVTQRTATSLEAFSKSLALSGESTLSPIQKYEETRKQMEALKAAALGGDQDAASKFGQAATAFLAQSRNVNASGSAYAKDYTDVQGTAGTLATKYGAQATGESQMVGVLTKQTGLQEQVLASLQAQKQQAADLLGLLIARAQDTLVAGKSNTDAIVAILEKQRSSTVSGMGGIIDSLNAAANTLQGASRDTILGEAKALKEASDKYSGAMTAQITAYRDGSSAEVIARLSHIAALEKQRLDTGTYVSSMIGELAKAGLLTQKELDGLVAARSAAFGYTQAAIDAIRNGSSATAVAIASAVATLGNAQIKTLIDNSALIGELQRSGALYGDNLINAKKQLADIYAAGTDTIRAVQNGASADTVIQLAQLMQDKQTQLNMVIGDARKIDAMIRNGTATDEARKAVEAARAKADQDAEQQRKSDGTIIATTGGTTTAVNGTTAAVLSLYGAMVDVRNAVNTGTAATSSGVAYAAATYVQLMNVGGYLNAIRDYAVISYGMLYNSAGYLAAIRDYTVSSYVLLYNVTGYLAAIRDYTVASYSALTALAGRPATVSVAGGFSSFDSENLRLLPLYIATVASNTYFTRVALEAQNRKAGIPGYADGGLFGGGLRIVGERGPELEATGASRIFSADQTRDMLSSKASSDEQKQTNVELRALVRQNGVGVSTMVDRLDAVVDRLERVEKQQRLTREKLSK